MGRHNHSEDMDGRCCFGFLSVCFPGLRAPAQRCTSQERSTTSSGSSRSIETNSISSDAIDTSDESSPSGELESSSSELWSSMDNLQTTCSADSEVTSEDSDPQERVRRATASFLQWKNKEYVPLSEDEKRVIKEYRKVVAQEDGSHESMRAPQHRRRASKKPMMREGKRTVLDVPAEDGALIERRRRNIRFVAAMVASKEVDVHNNEFVVVEETGEKVPELPRRASILRKSSMADLAEEPPAFREDLSSNPPEGEG
ncbi:hypothetical protein, unknown function [Leishmania tarentolae]|uniref:Uncharacterized protein n=1 Tax=Leishmania tarentolae TaxID=5689 RepID=A0A640KNK5_LEITA|nr:hypothetical protein, unknown function [Leishmania tarentolae]